MPRLPADITLRTIPPARSAMETDAATNFSTMPGSLAAAIMDNVRRSTVTQLQRRRITVGDNERSEQISTRANATTADASIDLYLRLGPPPTTLQPRTIDRHNEYECRNFSILT